MADMINLPVNRPVVIETTALGFAILAILVCGETRKLTMSLISGSKVSYFCQEWWQTNP